MRQFLFASCFDHLIARFFGIVAVGGRGELGHCWKGINTLLLPLMGKDNGMMLEWLDPDIVPGMGCSCWKWIGRC